MTMAEADTLAPGALAGIRVLELANFMAGPFCGMLLADMGAEVIKVENPAVGDYTRTTPPFVNGESAGFLTLNRNKKSVTLNLKAPEGRELLKKLARKSDVVLENFRTGTMEKLGLGYATLAKLNPRLVYCAISGFGESGPESHRGGYDLIVQAESGVMDLTGFTDGPPVKVGNSIADLVAGMSGAHGVTLALLARQKTRRGQKVEIAMLDVMASLLTYQAGMYLNGGRTPARRGNEHPSIVPYEVFKAADGYLALGVANNSLWERCCAALERPDLARDARFATEASRVEHRATLVPLLNEVLGARSGADWMKRLEAVGVPAGRIRTVPEVCESEHLRARGMLVALPHAKAGTVKMMGVPIRLHRTPGRAKTAAPLLGADTEAVLMRILGLRRPDVQRLRKAGVL